MPTTIHITYTVEGEGLFPIDMLRYDGVHPHHETDSYAVAESCLSSRRTITLRKPNTYKGWKPGISRWESFGWKVIDGPQIIY